MSIAVAVLTWNREPALARLLASLRRHAGSHRLAVFEDAGLTGATVRRALDDAHTRTPRPDLLAEQVVSSSGQTTFLGTRNLGVAGNSNRAIRWFMHDTDADYLCLCNDDVEATGDFPAFYHNAYRESGIGLFCFCDIASFGWDTVTWLNFQFKVLHRLSGAVLSFPRALIDRIGYFNVELGKFGEEHCEFTRRAKLTGWQQVHKTTAECVDVVGVPLRHQEVESTVDENTRELCGRNATEQLKKINYMLHGYRYPFRLEPPRIVGGLGEYGTAEIALGGYHHTSAGIPLPLCL